MFLRPAVITFTASLIYLIVFFVVIIPQSDDTPQRICENSTEPVTESFAYAPWIATLLLIPLSIGFATRDTYFLNLAPLMVINLVFAKLSYYTAKVDPNYYWNFVAMVFMAVYLIVDLLPDTVFLFKMVFWLAITSVCLCATLFTSDTMDAIVLAFFGLLYLLYTILYVGRVYPSIRWGWIGNLGLVVILGTTVFAVVSKDDHVCIESSHIIMESMAFLGVSCVYVSHYIFDQSEGEIIEDDVLTTSEWSVRKEDDDVSVETSSV